MPFLLYAGLPVLAASVAYRVAQKPQAALPDHFCRDWYYLPLAFNPGLVNSYLGAQKHWAAQPEPYLNIEMRVASFDTELYFFSVLRVFDYRDTQKPRAAQPDSFPVYQVRASRGAAIR